MVNFYAVSLLVFVLGSVALVIVFVWQLASGKLRPRDTFGRGFEPVFPIDRKQVSPEKNALEEGAQHEKQIEQR